MNSEPQPAEAEFGPSDSNSSEPNPVNSGLAGDSPASSADASSGPDSNSDSSNSNHNNSGLDAGLTSGLDSLMPALLFLIFNWAVGLPWAIGAATVWSLKVVYTRRRKRLPLGKLFPLVAGFVLLRGIIGIVTDSEAVYFGLGIASKYAIGLGVAASAIINRNVIIMAAPYVFNFPTEVKNHPVYKSALDVVAYLAGFYYLLSASFDIWLYNNNSVEGYIIIRLIVNWPLGLAVFWGCLGYVVFRLRKVPEFPGLYKLLEHRTESLEHTIELRLEERRQRKAAKRQAKQQADSGG